MRFVEINSPRPADLDRIGKVEYVVWRYLYMDGKKFVQMFPNNATVNDRKLAAMCDFPQDAWELVKAKPELIEEFGMEI